MDNEKKYLDKSGLTEYHEKIKEYINTEDDKKLGATISYDDYMALPEEERNVGNYYIPDYPMDTQVVIVDGKIGEKITWSSQKINAELENTVKNDGVVKSIMAISQAEYDALSVKDNSVLYLIS